MIDAVGSDVPIKAVESSGLAAVDLKQPINGIAIEGIGDGLVSADECLQVERSDVVVVVVGFAGVTTPLVEFARQKGIVAAIVEGIENWYAVDCQRNGAAIQGRAGRDGIDGRRGIQRDLPCFAAIVGLCQRYLPLPAGNAHHHVVTWQAARFYIQIGGVTAGTHQIREILKSQCLERLGGDTGCKGFTRGEGFAGGEGSARRRCACAGTCFTGGEGSAGGHGFAGSACFASSHSFATGGGSRCAPEWVVPDDTAFVATGSQ